MKVTIKDNLTNDEYRKIKGISASDLKTMTISIDMFIHKDKLMNSTQANSKALVMGTALHEGLLEPDKFSISKYRMGAADMAKLKLMINNGNVVFGDILSKTKNELSILVEDEDLGITRKCRPDAYDENKGIIYDVKTTKYGSIQQFIRNDILGLNYDLQAAWYLDTLKIANKKANFFVFLVIQNQVPHNIFAVECHSSLIEQGREKYSNVISSYQEYLNTKQAIDIRTAYSPEYIAELSQ